MKCKEIIDCLEAQGEWVDRSFTKDRVLVGDPQAQLKGVGVCWTASLAMLEKMVSAGVNLVVSHENPFYLESTCLPSALKETKDAKRRYCEENGMVIYRCHDLWDRFPAQGVLDSWSEQIGVGIPREANGFIRLIDVPSTTAGLLARSLAGVVSRFGEDGLSFIGDPVCSVSCLAVGTGAITDVFRMRDLGADACLVTDDGIRSWVEIQWAADEGMPLFIVTHRTSEMAGMQGLADYLSTEFPDQRVELYRSDVSIEHIAC